MDFKMTEIVGNYKYERVGYDHREMELKEDGTIGIGSAERERRWSIRTVNGNKKLLIIDEYGGVTCELEKHSDNSWRGWWNNYERMPIILSDINDISPIKMLTATEYNKQYYEEHKIAGIDYLYFGEWQQIYGKWIERGMKWHGKTVLDVGCACGSIMRGMIEAGIIVQGIDLSQHMIDLAGEKWADMKPILHCGDADDLSRFDDESFDGIHTTQVAEHWNPDAVPQILKELARITRKDGHMYVALDTEELFIRQNRNMETEDPTHLCIRPMSWWRNRLAETGWLDVSEQFKKNLLEQEIKFVQQHDWDWFVARKIN